MATFTKLPLSASTNGRGIKVAAVATAGTTIHTGSSSTSTSHELWLYCQNSDGSSHKLTVEYGGTTSPDDQIEVTVPAESGLTLVVPGLVIVGNATPLVVRAFADLTNVLIMHGYVNEIS